VHTVLRSDSKQVIIGHDQPFCVIGERINPTGRKKFAEALRAGDLSQVITDVRLQVAAGAHVLDVNAGVPLTDEPELLAKTILLAQEHTDLPICIDSSVVEALEAGLAVYRGKALVNSVTGEDDRLAEILPLVKRHGAAIIALANDETGIPETAADRLEITGKIVKVATEEYGIPIEDIVIDPLAMTVGADTDAVNVTLETIRAIRDAYGLNMTLGGSNVSFGLPDRHVLSAAFVQMAMAAGLTSAIMNALAPEIVAAARASDLLLGRDPWGANWIASYRARKTATESAAQSAAQSADAAQNTLQNPA
jgi:5-methyltetrahydrofolate--homocysteine methyltransferase